jgi:hypothetical protein
MTKDIAKHIEEWTTCQYRRQQHHQKDKILLPLPLCTEPNQREHVDLFCPLKTEKGKKWSHASQMLSKNMLIRSY